MGRGNSIRIVYHKDSENFPEGETSGKTGRDATKERDSFPDISSDRSRKLVSKAVAMFKALELRSQVDGETCTQGVMLWSRSVVRIFSPCVDGLEEEHPCFSFDVPVDFEEFRSSAPSAHERAQEADKPVSRRSKDDATEGKQNSQIAERTADTSAIPKQANSISRDL